MKGNEPNSETFADLCRLAPAASLPAQNQRAQKMIVALAREAGVISENYDNYSGADAIRGIFSLPSSVPGALDPRPERPSLPEEFRHTVPSVPVTRDRFGTRNLDERAKMRVAAIRAAFQAVEDVVLHVTATGRLQSLVLTALEEACMWAVKAISHENG